MENLEKQCIPSNCSKTFTFSVYSWAFFFRLRFVCAVGESRWAEVTFNTKNADVTVNAWTTDDAKEALYQARLSAVSSSTSYRCLMLNTNKYRNLWGQPLSSTSPAAEAQSPYSEELRHWLPICTRYGSLHKYKFVFWNGHVITYHT